MMKQYHVTGRKEYVVWTDMRHFHVQQFFFIFLIDWSIEPSDQQTTVNNGFLVDISLIGKWRMWCSMWLAISGKLYSFLYSGPILKQLLPCDFCTLRCSISTYINLTSEYLPWLKKHFHCNGLHFLWHLRYYLMCVK